MQKHRTYCPVCVYNEQWTIKMTTWGDREGDCLSRRLSGTAAALTAGTLLGILQFSSHPFQNFLPFCLFSLSLQDVSKCSKCNKALFKWFKGNVTCAILSLHHIVICICLPCLWKNKQQKAEPIHASFGLVLPTPRLLRLLELSAYRFNVLVRSMYGAYW